MKTRRFVTALLAASLLTQPIAVQAAAAEATVPKGPSAFVRCDGSPNKASTLGTVARLVAITAIVGLLLPDREGPDPKKRENGEAGVKACDEALTGTEPAKDGGRRIELIYGRAIHRMEAGDWDGAIADLRSANVDQPDLTQTAAFKQSLGLTALALEGMALVGKGDMAGAQAIGFKLHEVAPYDLINMIYAQMFVRLGGDYTPEREQFYAQMVRIYPTSLADRADQLARARRFADAGADLLTLSRYFSSIPKVKGYLQQARAAVALRLAGQGAEADKLMEAARQSADADVAAGKNDSLNGATSEAADLYAIITALDGGQAMRARTLFAARTRWTMTPVGFVAEVSRRLTGVGTPAEQANTPIPSPADLLKADQDRLVALINNTGDDNSDRFDAYRPAVAPTEFAKFANNVWKTDKSRYIGKTPNEPMDAEFISVFRNGGGVPGNYAMLLHLALIAKARGAAGFELMPFQSSTASAMFRMGASDDKRLFAPLLFDPDKVIADLAPVIPKPVKGK